jgi:hypothetical protein
VALKGRWGFQVVSLAGDAAGLSANGRVLVASTPPANPAGLAGPSRFTVLRTAPLRVAQSFTLPGSYTVDAVSPDGSKLFLIQHVEISGDWTMRGYPLARAATASESSVYTLYQPDGNYPFIHALDTVHASAVCIGLPLSWTGNTLDGAKLTLSDDGSRLVVSGPHIDTPVAVDTRTLQIVH